MARMVFHFNRLLGCGMSELEGAGKGRIILVSAPFMSSSSLFLLLSLLAGKNTELGVQHEHHFHQFPSIQV